MPGATLTAPVLDPVAGHATSGPELFRLSHGQLLDVGAGASQESLIRLDGRRLQSLAKRRLLAGGKHQRVFSNLAPLKPKSSLAGGRGSVDSAGQDLAHLRKNRLMMQAKLKGKPGDTLAGQSVDDSMGNTLEPFDRVPSRYQQTSCFMGQGAVVGGGKWRAAESQHAPFTSVSKDAMFSVVGVTAQGDYDPVLSIYESDDPLLQQQSIDVSPPPVVSQPQSKGMARFHLGTISAAPR